MNQPINTTLTMPSPIDLVKQTLDSYDVDHSKSKLVGIAPATMLTVGLMLVDPAMTISEALATLLEAEGDDVCSRSAFYVFASDFRGRFDSLRKQHRARAMRLTAGDVTDGKLKDMTDLVKARVVTLLAEKAVDTQTIENLTGRDLNAMLALTRMVDEGDRDNRTLQLKAEDADRKQAKLEADLQKAELDRAALQQKIDEFKRQMDDEIAAAQAKVDNADGLSIQDRLQQVSERIFGRKN